MAENKEINEKLYRWNKEKLPTDNQWARAEITNRISTDSNEKTARNNQWVSTNKIK